jgi:hypothetical protein
MRDVNRIPRIIHDLERLWKQHPDQRLGQLLENYIFTNGKRGDKTSVALFYQEDDFTGEKIVINTDFERRDVAGENKKEQTEK